MKKITLNCKKLFLTFSILLISALSYSQIALRGTAMTATGSGTTLTITKPTGIAVGDLMIANIAKGGDNTTAVTSTGWTLIDGRSLGGSGTQRYGAVLYKIAVAADVSAANYAFTLGASTDSSVGAIIAFSGIDSTNPFDVTSGVLSLSNSAAATGSTKTTVTLDAAIVMLSQSAGLDPSWSGWSTTSPGALAELFDVQNSAGTKSSVGGAWAIKNATGATGAGTVNLSGSQRNGGILLAIRPAAVACTTYSLSSTVATSPICAGATTTITLNNTTTSNLPTGTYTVTYNLGAPNAATGLTSTMTVSTAGTGTFTTSALANSGATGITITNLTKGSCSSTISTFNTSTITVNTLPTVGAGSALTAICQGGVTAALGGSFGGSATAAVWSTTSGGTFANNSGTTPNTTTWTPPAGFTGTATLVLTTSGGSCGTTNTSKTQVVQTATVNAGSALATICQGGTSAALGGSFGGSATGAIWTDGGVGGTFANNSGTTPATTTWTPPAAYLGTATLTLTTTGGSCGTTTTSKTQTVSTPSTATVGSAFSITGSLTSTSLGGNTPSVGSGVWSVISGPSGTVTFSNATSGSSTATVPSIGTYVFRWTVTGCGTSFAEITVTYLDANNHREYTLFYEDFDASNGGWTNKTATNTHSWLWTNSFPTLTINEIGENSFWRLNNFKNYPDNATIEIESPVYNFTGYENLIFNIDVRRNTQSDMDGMRILYSINGGAYVLLGASGSGVNWYNSTTVSALGSNGWSGNNVDVSSPLTFGPANRFFRATTTLADATFRNQSNVRFMIQFKSNGSTTSDGVAFDNVAVEGDPMVALVASPIAPANINQNLRLWFKSNAGIAATDGTALTAWEDQAYDVTRTDLVNKESVKALASDAPTYRDNAARNINFNPVVDFNAANKDYMNGKGGLYSQDYFVVVYSDNLVENTMGTTVRQIPLGGKSDEQSFHEDPTGLGLGNTTARYGTPEVISHTVGAYAPGNTSAAPGVDSYGRSFSSTTVTYNEPLIINVKTNANGTQTEIYKNGVKIDNTAGKTGDFGTGNLLNFYEYKNLPFYLGTGRSGISGRAFSALNGRLTEVIAYTAPNSDLNQQKIQSYLGIKYGITLHANTSTNDSGVSTTTRLNDVNYINSAGNVIWNTASNSGFNYDIAAIGRDDNSQLYQKQSKSVNSTDDITIGLTDIAATNNLNSSTCNDKNFLVWGNNNATLAAQPAVIVNMSAGITPALTTNVDFVSIGRTWKVIEVGSIQTTKIAIPTTMLSATITPPGDYLMFVSNTPAFDPTAEYRVMTVNGSNLETTYDFNGTKYITFGFAPEKTFVRSIAFDGVNDYLDAGKVLNLNTSFSVSAWVKRNSTNQTILSKRDNTFTTGYDLSINSAGKAEMKWINGTTQTITSSVTIPSGIWHNIAVTFNGTTALLYIDGVLDVTKPLSTVPSNTQSFLIAAADGTTPTSFFSGNIDEVRVWNVALTDKQLRYVMNQEILSNGLATNGYIVPNTITLNDISSIPWTNLSAYYPMSTYTYTNAKDVSVNNYTASLVNLTTVDRQTAPLPYESVSNGPWQTPSTWLNNTVQDIPNSLSIVDGVTPINWNIVKTSHNISSTGNKDLLALFVNLNTLSANNDSKIEVSHYLKLDGKIDLVNKSQLVQRLNSDLDPTSAGFIERDQLGQKSIFNYNYWGSPVGAINTTTNNTTFTVAGVMKDGTSATPQDLLWTGSYNGSPTTPAVTLSTYWIYKFQNLSQVYANWAYVGQNGTLAAAQGYTLKGSGSAAANQTYTFVGKPNNGTITTPIAANNLSLVGNPYASALDANAFILANKVATSGVLYFWEHYSSNNSHNLAAYQGGYATKTLTGATPPAAPVGISGLGSSSKTPKQYIPVGQGFFVEGSAVGGSVVFNNSQREFSKEDNTDSFTLFKSANTASLLDAQEVHFNNNQDYQENGDNFKRVRLGMTSSDQFHREILIGFMEEKATAAIDPGYDAVNFDPQPSDFYFMNSNQKLTISGEDALNIDTFYPLGITTAAAGNVTITLDGKENMNPNQMIYIYDNVENTFNSISQNQNYVVNLPQTVVDNRFFLTFKNTTASLGVGNVTLNDGIQVIYSNNDTTLSIKNNVVDTTVQTVVLFNMLGQQVGSYDVQNQTQTNIVLPIQTLSAGTYIVKMLTDKGNTSRKIIIN